MFAQFFTDSGGMGRSSYISPVTNLPSIDNKTLEFLWGGGGGAVRGDTKTKPESKDHRGMNDDSTWTRNNDLHRTRVDQSEIRRKVWIRNGLLILDQHGFR